MATSRASQHLIGIKLRWLQWGSKVRRSSLGSCSFLGVLQGDSQGSCWGKGRCETLAASLLTSETLPNASQNKELREPAYKTSERHRTQPRKLKTYVWCQFKIYTLHRKDTHTHTHTYIYICILYIYIYVYAYTNIYKRGTQFAKKRQWCLQTKRNKARSLGASSESPV